MPLYQLVTCDDCRGEGRVALLTSVEACRRCAGTGSLCAVWDTARRAWIMFGQDGSERVIPECDLVEGYPAPRD